MTFSGSQKIGMIVNPVAGNGRGGRMARRARRALARAGAPLGTLDVWETERPGHERELAHAAIQRGYTILVVVGGDGTLSHVANAILTSNSATRLTPIAGGSANDFARSLRIPAHDVRAMARATAVAANDTAPHAEHRTEQRVDVGCVEQEYFLNSCGFGFDVAVLQARARSKRNVGRLSYLWSALHQLHTYHGFSASIGDGPSFRHLLIVAANAPRFGGTFLIAPDASTYDGALDLIEMWSPKTVWMRLKLLRAAIRGRHVHYLRNTRVTQAGSLTIKFDAPPLCQLDGEIRQLGTKVVTVRCIPNALRIIGAPPPPPQAIHHVVQRAAYAAQQRP